MPTRKKDRGPSLDTLNLEVDKKTDFYGTVLKDLASVDSIDRKAYQKRVNEKKLKLKIKEKEAEAAKHKGPTVSISAPVDSDEEFEGVENYEKSGKSEENSDDSSDSSDSSDEDEDEQKSKEENKNTQKSNQASFGGPGKNVGEKHLCTWYET